MGRSRPGKRCDRLGCGLIRLLGPCHSSLAPVLVLCSMVLCGVPMPVMICEAWAGWGVQSRSRTGLLQQGHGAASVDLVAHDLAQQRDVHTHGPQAHAHQEAWHAQSALQQYGQLLSICVQHASQLL